MRNLQPRPNIYIIGAPSTGKSTLVDDLEAFITSSSDQLEAGALPRPTVIREVAREVLKKHGFTREEIRSSKARCFQLQQCILQEQFSAEKNAATTSSTPWVISDRSGIDPIMFTKRFVGEAEVGQLKAMPEWAHLSANMKRSLVLLCEAGVEWLVDDGTRLMPVDKEEWMAFHHTFCEVLEDAQIPYVVIQNTLAGRKERVDFAYRQWEALVKREVEKNVEPAF